MKFIKNIRDWFDNKLIDTLAGKAIDWWQSQHPASFALVSGAMITVHAWATTTLEEAAALCASSGICMPKIEETSTLIIYWVSLIIAVLSGTKPISAIRDEIQNKEQKP